jgi:uncharacterized repeat protein (TIGR03803 family)
VHLGRNPTGKLTEGANGKLYGTTYHGGNFGYGVLFRIEKDGSGYQILRHFAWNAPGDGRNPNGTLVRGGDGFLYGTTEHGGLGGNVGTVFRIGEDGDDYQILHSGGNLVAAIWSVHCSSRVISGCMAIHEVAVLMGWDIVFRLGKDGAGFELLHHFGSMANDATPPLMSGLIELPDGFLYGTSSVGGEANAGTIFRLEKDGTGYQLLHQFGADDGDGRSPQATLAVTSSGQLIGVTSGGGIFQFGGHGRSEGGGTVFALDTNGSNYQVLNKFTGQGLEATPTSWLLWDRTTRLQERRFLAGAWTKASSIVSRETAVDFQSSRNLVSPQRTVSTPGAV